MLESTPSFSTLLQDVHGYATRRSNIQCCFRLQKKYLYVSLILICSARILPAWSEDTPPIGQINSHFRVLGELRARYEGFDFFEPTLNPQRGVVANENRYNFGGIRARLGLAMTTPWVDGLVQGQYSGLYGLPEEAFSGLTVGPLGLGGAYYRENGSPYPGQVFLKQGYLKCKLQPMVGLANTFFQGGRFVVQEGLEYKTGDAQFDFLKATRVSQRLIGPFDFTHITRSFDGFSLTYDNAQSNVTLTAVHPTQGGFNTDAQDQISHIDLAYGAFTMKKDTVLPGTEGRVFYIYYGDDRNVFPVDNRPLNLRPALNQERLAIHTIGMNWLTVQPWGTGKVDGLFWGAYQFGDWGHLDHDAYSIDAELGYQWTETPLKPWLRVGYSRSSGDSDAKDHRHGTFFQVIPTVRLYAKFPFYSLMNLQDAFAQLSIAPLDNIKLGIDIHHLFLTESRDLLYGGSGATSRSGTFGYFGRASGGYHTVGQMVDLSLTHTLNSYFSWGVYYAHAFGDDVAQSVYSAKHDADYGFVEFTASF